MAGAALAMTACANVDPYGYTLPKECASLHGTTAIVRIISQQELQAMAPHARGTVHGAAIGAMIFLQDDPKHAASALWHELCHVKAGAWHD
jgi:hypothetical protein